MCAGLSADSGLPIYDQIANEPAWTERRLTYGDLCRPSLLETDPDMAYGFWSERERGGRERDRTYPVPHFLTLSGVKWLISLSEAV
jgi:hypothetical protein